MVFARLLASSLDVTLNFRPSHLPWRRLRSLTLTMRHTYCPSSHGFLLVKGACFGGIKNRFVISDHTDSSPPKNGRSGKRIIYHDKGMSSCSSSEKKQQEQTDPQGEDKKKKHYKLRMNIRIAYISARNTNGSRIEYTPKVSKIIRI